MGMLKETDRNNAGSGAGAGAAKRENTTRAAAPNKRGVLAICAGVSVHARNKRGVLAICAGVSVCYLVAVMCAQAFLPASTPVLGFGSADPGNTATIMILLSPALALWGFSVRQRCPDHFIGKRLVSVVGLLAFWLALVVVKYPSQNDAFIIMCWYLYYVPVLLFACSLRAATYEATRAGCVMRCAAVCISAALGLLVLTNNAHMWVFSFAIEQGGWSGKYAYNWGYWVVVAWLVLLYAASFLLLFRASQKNLKPAFFPLLVCGGLGFAYCVLYILRTEFLFQTNFSLMCVVLLMVAIEIILDVGIFPSSWHYAKIFESLPYRMALVSKNGVVAYVSGGGANGAGAGAGAEGAAEGAVAAAGAGAEGAAEESVAAAGAGAEGAAAVVWLKTSESAPAENTLVRKFPIKGGEAVSVYDITEINKRKRVLTERSKKLAQANLILEQTIAAKRAVARQASEEKLLRAIDAQLQDKVAEIDYILQHLPEEEEVTAAAAAGNTENTTETTAHSRRHSERTAQRRVEESMCSRETLPCHTPKSPTTRAQMHARDLSAAASSAENTTAARAQMLARVKFLTAYCKRKASLVISETEHATFDQAQVNLIFTEAASDFRSMGVECGAIVQNLAPINAATMEKLYDAVYSEMERAINEGAKFALISISDAENNTVEVRFCADEEIRLQRISRGWPVQTEDVLSEKGARLNSGNNTANGGA